MRDALVALVLAGCGLAGCGPADEGSRPPPPAEARFVEPECPTGAAEPDAGTAVPADFAVAWVLRCEVAEGSGVTERADPTPAEAAALLAELRRPSDSRTTGTCPTILILPPYVVLVDSTGRAVHPAVPTDPCGQPRESARDAVAALDFREESRTPLSR